MKAKLCALSLIGILFLLGLPARAQAQSITCNNPATAMPDGRLPSITHNLPNATNHFWFIFTIAGRSYSVEVKDPFVGYNQWPLVTIFTSAGGACSTMATVRDTSLIEPRIDASFASFTGQRVSFTATDPSFHVVRVSNASGAPRNYTLIISDTTMFSPGWSTMGGLQTFWSFFNTTNDTINGTITLLDTNGTQVAAQGVAIPTNRAAFPSTITLGVAANRAGTARFTHDGPPGAVLAEGAITNFAGFFQRVRFEPVRQQR